MTRCRTLKKRQRTCYFKVITAEGAGQLQRLIPDVLPSNQRSSDENVAFTFHQRACNRRKYPAGRCLRRSIYRRDDRVGARSGKRSAQFATVCAKRTAGPAARGPATKPRQPAVPTGAA